MRGFGRVAAMRAHSLRVSSDGILLKFCFATAYVPYIPLPISMELRYTSMILCFPQKNSISMVKYASRPFLSHERPCQRKTFFAVC